jgi:hypothetical protein
MTARFGVSKRSRVPRLGRSLALPRLNRYLPSPSASGYLNRANSIYLSKRHSAKSLAAMIISGPWAWSNLTKSGIDFGLARMPGVNGKPGRPFIGVTAAYINRSSANTNLALYFIEHPQMGRFFSVVGTALQIATQEALNDAAATLRSE